MGAGQEGARAGLWAPSPTTPSPPTALLPHCTPDIHTALSASACSLLLLKAFEVGPTITTDMIHVDVLAVRFYKHTSSNYKCYT